MPFRDRLLATLRAVRGVLEVPGVMVVGSEVPNLLQDGAASTLVVSQAVDLGIPIAAHAEVKERLERVLGIDPSRHDPADTYELPDARLPLMVFALLSLLRPGPAVRAGDLAIPVPRPAGRRSLGQAGGAVSSIGRRVAAVRSRARVRRWEYRQRNLAHGAWYRLRRALTFAEQAFSIDEAEAHELLAAGAARDTAGADLEPPRVLVWIERAQLPRLRTARPLRLKLDAALLSARWIALVPFGDRPPPAPR